MTDTRVQKAVILLKVRQLCGTIHAPEHPVPCTIQFPLSPHLCGFPLSSPALSCIPYSHIDFTGQQFFNKLLAQKSSSPVLHFGELALDKYKL